MTNKEKISEKCKFLGYRLLLQQRICFFRNNGGNLTLKKGHGKRQVRFQEHFLILHLDSTGDIEPFGRKAEFAVGAVPVLVHVGNGAFLLFLQAAQHLFDPA